MKSVILALAIMAAILGQGCATTSTTGTPQTAAQKQQHAAQIINDNQEFIGATLDAVRVYVISSAVDENSRARLETKLSMAADQLDALVATKKFDPASFRAVFQIKEARLDAYLSLVPAAYALIYKYSGADPALLEAVLKSCAEGLR